jgi:predicted esterase
VFLLHGSDDPIIPFEETPNLAADLRARGNTHVEWLVSPVLAHVEIASAVSLSDAWRLVSFWTKVDAQAGR